MNGSVYPVVSTHKRKGQTSVSVGSREHPRDSLHPTTLGEVEARQTLGKPGMENEMRLRWKQDEVSHG